MLLLFALLSLPCFVSADADDANVQLRDAGQTVSTVGFRVGVFIHMRECVHANETFATSAVSPLQVQVNEAVKFAVERINRNKSLLPRGRLIHEYRTPCRDLLELLWARSGLYMETKKKGEAPMMVLYATQVEDLYEVFSPEKEGVYQLTFVPQNEAYTSDGTLYSLAPSLESEARATVKFLASENWTLFSVVYSSHQRRYNALDCLRNAIKATGLCITTAIELSRDMTSDKYRYVIKDLLKHEETSVVVLSTGVGEMRMIFRAVHELGATGKLIWIGSSGWAGQSTTLESKFRGSIVGSFTISPAAPSNLDFKKYLSTLTPFDGDVDEYFALAWEKVFNCSLEKKTCDKSRRLTETPEFPIYGRALYAIDAVYTIAHYLQTILKTFCGDIRSTSKWTVTNCSDLIERDAEKMFKHMRTVSFQGYTGHVTFNDKGYRATDFVISQISLSDNNTGDNRLAIVEKAVLKIDTTNENSIVRIRDIKRSLTPFYHDSPRCTRRCGNGELEVQVPDHPCCKRCIKCRADEGNIFNSTGCTHCPLFQWPDESSNFTSCAPIDPTSSTEPGGNPGVAILIFLSAVGLVLTLAVVVFYKVFLQYLNNPFIAFDFTHLVAILLGFAAIPLILVRATDTTCLAALKLIMLMYSLLYAPMLVKIIFIHRLSDSNRQARLVISTMTSYHQVSFAVCFVIFQYTIFQLLSIDRTVAVRLDQPDASVNYVEWVCVFPLPCKVYVSCSIMVLVIMCSVLAFRNHNLHDEYGSRFISYCMIASVVVSVALIPPLVMANRFYVRAVLTATALLVINSMYLLCLFVPKMLAIKRRDSFDNSIVKIDNAAAQEEPIIVPVVAKSPSIISNPRSTSV